MPNNSGAERFINSHIGEIKRRDEPIVIDFEKPNGEHVVLTFESYVTRADLKAALRHVVAHCVVSWMYFLFGHGTVSNGSAHSARCGVVDG